MERPLRRSMRRLPPARSRPCRKIGLLLPISRCPPASHACTATTTRAQQQRHEHPCRRVSRQTIGKPDVEHFLDRQRPQHVPVARQIAGGLRTNSGAGRARRRSRAAATAWRARSHNPGRRQVQRAQQTATSASRHGTMRAEAARVERALELDPTQAAPSSQRIGRRSENPEITKNTNTAS